MRIPILSNLIDKTVKQQVNQKLSKLMNDQFQTDYVDKKYVYNEQSYAPENKIEYSMAYERHIWTFACIHAIATTISNVPLRLYPKGKDEEITQGDLWELINMPNEDNSYNDLMEAFVSFAELTGDSFIELNDPLYPTAMKVLRAYWMDIDLDRKRNYVYRYKPSGSAEIVFTPGEVVHFKYFNPNSDLYGQSAITTVTEDIVIDKNSTRYTKDFFAKGGMINLYLKVKASLQDFEFKRLKQETSTNVAGIKNANTIPVLDNDAELKSAGFDVNQVLMESVKTSVRDEILAAFGVPPIAITVFADATYNNADTQWKAFYTQTILPKLKKIESFFNRNIFWKQGYEVFFDISGIQALKEDELKKAQTATAMKAVLTVNEIRELLYDLNPIEGGDTIATTPQPVAMQLSYNEPVKKSLASAINVQLIKAATDNHNKHFENAVAKYEQALQPFFQAWENEVLSAASDATIQKSAADALETAIGKLPARTKDLMKRLSKVSDEEARRIMASDYTRMTGTGTITPDSQARILTNIRSNIAKWTGPSAESITNTIQERLTNVIKDNYQDIAKLTKAVQETFESIKTNQAKMIARTESASIANTTRIEVAKDLGFTKKTWIAQDGPTGRDWHTDLNGTTVAIEDSFNVEGIAMQYPGDFAGGPHNNCNCRCTTIER